MSARHALLALAIVCIYAAVSLAAEGNMATQAQSATTEILRISDATWRIRKVGAAYIRLHFHKANLPSTLLLNVSDSSGHSVQRLDARTRAAWSDSTAYFNGDSVIVSVETSDGMAVPIGAVEAKLRALTVETEADMPRRANVDRPGQIIGTDDRVHATDRAVGRIDPIGCTGWLISIGIGLTAGHCLDPTNTHGDPQLIEFDVPASLPNGTVQHPPADEQFPISWDAGDWLNGATGTGNDWGVFAIGLNGTGTSVFRDHPFFRPTSDNPILVGRRLGVTGYGQDDDPPSPTDFNAQSQTEQYSRGALLAFLATYLTYDADTQGGSSGSPVLVPGSRLAFGIHTNAEDGINCVTVPHCNGGTNFTSAGLKAAIDNKRRTGTEVMFFVDWMTPPWNLHPDGSATSPYPTIEDALSAHIGAGFTLGLVEGHYDGRAGSYASNGGPNTSLILRALTGQVTLGPVPRPFGNAL